MSPSKVGVLPAEAGIQDYKTVYIHTKSNPRRNELNSKYGSKEKDGLMASLIFHQNPTATWHMLVSEAEARAGLVLKEHVESYLVFLLMRFTTQPTLANSVLGLEFLEGLQTNSNPHQLRDVGDKCLLVSGLFPGRAQKRRVSVDYFVNIGRTAYSTFALDLPHETSKLYTTLSEEFICLTDVLVATRSLPLQSHPSQVLALIEQLDARIKDGSLH